MTPPSLRLRLRTVALLLVPSAIFLAYALHRAWPHTLDDGFVFLRYAQNFVAGDGLAFSPGERVEGFSNALWVALLALGGTMGIPYLELAKGLGSAFAGATLITSVWLALRLLAARQRGTGAVGGRFGPASGALAIGGLLVVHPGFGYYAVSGLGTSLTTLLTVLGVGLHLIDSSDDSSRRSRRCYLPLGFAAITRPDAPLILGVVLIQRLWLGRQKERATATSGKALAWPGELLTAAVAGLPLLGLLIARWLYYGDLLPNTYYAKPSSLAENPAFVVAYFANFVTGHGLWLAVVLTSLAVAAFVRPTHRHIALLVSGPCVTHLAVVLCTGGDWLPQDRFIQPVLPLLYLVPILGLAALPPTSVTPVGLILFVSVAIRAPVCVRFFDDLDGNSAYDQALTCERNVEMARWMAANLEPGSSLLTDEIGAIGLYSGLEILDQWGLVDREVAQILHQRRFNPYTRRPDDPERRDVQDAIAVELLSREPDYVTIDCRGPVPGPDGYDPKLVLSITMAELLQRMGDRYAHVRGFTLMEVPPKTFLLFRAR
ncbi:MAG: hypothetical protein V3V08_17340 [Nannocystaceae bacterium]